MSEQNESTDELAPAAPAPTEALAPMSTEDMIALARSYVASGTGKGIKKNDLVRFMHTLVAAANAESTGAPPPDAQPAAATFTPDDKLLAAHAFLAEGRARIAELEAALATQAVVRASGIPEQPPGDHSYICSAAMPNEDGTALHVAKRANRDYTRNEAIALGLDILRKVRAIS